MSEKPLEIVHSYTGEDGADFSSCFDGREGGSIISEGLETLWWKGSGGVFG